MLAGLKSGFPITFCPTQSNANIVFSVVAVVGTSRTGCSRKAKISSCSCPKSPAYCRCTMWRAWASVRTASDWRAPRNALSCIGRRWRRRTTTTTTDRLYDVTDAVRNENGRRPCQIKTPFRIVLGRRRESSIVHPPPGVVCDSWPRNR